MENMYKSGKTPHDDDENYANAFTRVCQCVRERVLFTFRHIELTFSMFFLSYCTYIEAI